MKRKIAVLMLLVFALTAVLTGCGGDKTAQESDGSWDRVVKAGKITAGLDDAYPPMGYHDPQTDELIGFDIAMAAAISEKIGVEIEFIPADWNSIVPSLTSGKFDLIISGMNMLASREEQVDFIAYGVAGQALVVKADDPNMDAIAEGGLEYFLDKNLGTQLGSTGSAVAMNNGFTEGKNLTLYKAYPDAILDLSTGRLDALIIDTFNATEMLSSGKYVQVGATIFDESEGPNSAKIGIAINKTDKELKAKLEQAVNELIVDGTLAALSEEWIGFDITGELVDDAQSYLDANK